MSSRLIAPGLVFDQYGPSPMTRFMSAVRPIEIAANAPIATPIEAASVATSPAAAAATSAVT